jgi:serine/threonine protein kinase, bacterial
VLGLRDPTLQGRDVTQPFELQPGQQPFPGFWLHLPIGRGGCGEVWETQTDDGPIALKFMRAKNTSSSTREIRSTEAIRRLRHPNLVRIHQVFSQAEYIVIGMELADGSLMDVLELYRDDRLRMSAQRVCAYLMQAAEALDFLNKQQHEYEGRIVAFQHGDVKPSNILLCGDTVKLADFGLATPLSYALQPHGRRGTLDFAAPELFRGQISDRTDQYALAITYFLMRTGRLPFAESPTRFTPTFLRSRPDLTLLTPPERLVISKALSISPVDRWPTCGVMMEKLSDALGDVLCGTQPDNTVYY